MRRGIACFLLLKEVLPYLLTKCFLAPNEVLPCTLTKCILNPS